MDGLKIVFIAIESAILLLAMLYLAYAYYRASKPYLSGLIGLFSATIVLVSYILGLSLFPVETSVPSFNIWPLLALFAIWFLTFYKGVQPQWGRALAIIALIFYILRYAFLLATWYLV